MISSSGGFRALIIYALCIPLALLLGYMLANPLSYSSLYSVGLVALALSFPMLLRWHYPLLLLSWNMSFSLFFVKGQPDLWLAMVPVSLTLSLLQRALLRERRFIFVPQVIVPLVCLVGVVLVTAKLTGGFGFHSLGSEVYGGKKYVLVLVGILGYFAITARQIPLEKAHLCVALFFLGGLTNMIGDFYFVAPRALEFIFWIFQPTSSLEREIQMGMERFRGVAIGGFFAYCWIMAQYGIRGIFLSPGKWWRLLLFALIVLSVFLGGFRSALLGMALIFATMFFMEGLHRSKLVPAFVLAGMLGAAVLIPLARQLPFPMQRALAFLPLDLDKMAVMDAEGSTQWRFDMWEGLLPQVPRHLLLGKGFAITREDYEMMGPDTSFRSLDPTQQGLALAYDYHNGPLSVLIPFGIWGAIAFCGFLVAGWWVVYRNYRYGDPTLKTLNIFLLVAYLYRVFNFFLIFGGINVDMPAFVGYVGLSVAINGGVCRRLAAPAEVPETNELPSFVRRSGRPSFQR
jgi:hypothetical protein